MNEKDLAQEQKTVETLQSLKATPARHPEQAAQGRKAFLAQAHQVSQQSVSIPLYQRLKNVFSQPQTQMRFSTLTIGVILSVLLLTFSSTAYAARLSKPDQPLYSFKLWLEDSRLSLTRQTDQQISLHMVFAEERLKELSAEGQVYSYTGADQALKNLSDHLAALRELLGEEQEDISQQDRLEKITQEYEKLEKHNKDQEQELEEADDEDASESRQEQIEEQEDRSDQDKDSDQKETESGADKDPEDDKSDEPDPTKGPEDDKPDEPDSSDDFDPTKTPKPDDD